MSRLIDADELKKQQTHLWDEVMGHVPCVLLYDIDIAPTIDAVPVVRCKDCKNGTVCVNMKGTEYVDCVLDDYSVRKPTDFCSYGEKRDG